MIDPELLKKAKEGDFDALFQVADSYYFGDDGEQDYKKAYLYYTKVFSIDPRNADLNNMLGLCFIHGHGIAQNQEKGVAFFKTAIAFGSIEAHVNLGKAYADGNGVEQDLAKAKNHYVIAANSGNTMAMIRLGDMYSEGIGVNQDYEKAFNYYKRAVDAGDTGGLYCLGYCYAEGKGVEKNVPTAIDCWKKASENGNEFAESQLGFCYKIGDGIEKNLREAAFWYKKSADHGYDYAVSDFACCIFGLEDATRTEIVEAVNYLTRASNAGAPKPTFILASVYNEGKFVNQNKELAYKLWAKGGNAGDGSCSRMAGNCCRDGEGTTRDIEKAMRWYSQGAKQGDRVATMLAGFEYYSGEKIVRDHKKALWFFLRAADLGDVKGNYYAALVYESGEDMEHNLPEAFKHYSIASDAGDVNAMVAKACYHMDGIGGAEKNETIGLELLESAYDNGSELAGDLMAEYFNKLTADELNKESYFKIVSKLAESGNPDAQYIMWKLYDEGIFVAKDVDKANTWLKKAADGGNDIAAGLYGLKMDIEGKRAECVSYWEKAKNNNVKIKTDLAVLYLNDKSGFKDIQQGIKLLNEAVEVGFPQAMAELGLCYAGGIGVPSNSNKAVNLLRAAANKNYVRAQFILGCMYRDGDHLPVSATDSIMWFTKASDAGDSDAHFMLGVMYFDGKLVPKDVDKAIFHFKKSLEDENILHRQDAQYLCGLAYVEKQRYSEAFGYFLEGAKSGDGDCQYQVGNLYTYGEGTEQDFAQAKLWLEKALQNGVNEAAVLLKQVEDERKMVNSDYVTEYRGETSLKADNLWEFMPIIRMTSSENVTLENIKKEFSYFADEYGISLAMGYGEIRKGGMFSSDSVQCLIIANSNHQNDYYKYCVSLAFQGKVPFVTINQFGRSPQMEKEGRAQFAKEDRKGKSLSYKLGSKFSEMILNAGKSADKFQEEQRFYAVMEDIISNVFGVQI